jgi:hypothetical protein
MNLAHRGKSHSLRYHPFHGRNVSVVEDKFLLNILDRQHFLVPVEICTILLDEA